MTRDEATPLVIDITREFVTLVREIEPQWRKAYLRFSLDGPAAEVKASYAGEVGVNLVDVTEHDDFFDLALEKGQELLLALGETRGVFLLVVDSDLKYQINFEHDDLGRWRISKMDGGTGVPEGLD